MLQFTIKLRHWIIMNNHKLEALKKKFLDTNREDSSFIKDVKTAIETDLPGWKITDDYISELNYSGNKTLTIKVEPKNGGPSKVADYKNGKIEIVQG